MRASRLLFVVGLSIFASSGASGQEKKPAPPTGKLTQAEWLAFPTEPLAAGEIDRLVSGELAKAGLTPAAKTTDEQFLRRVYLDVTGRPPVPADVTDFLKDPSPDKRAKLIDKLLDSDDYADHWSRYWREVITSRTTDPKVRLFAGHFERWLKQELAANKSWASITRDILTATGDIKQEEPDKNGQAFFLGTRFGADASTELAAETSRIFLGIQIQCAQCHDHPSDVWKREQFHEFAAYFARFRERPIRDGVKIVGQSIVSLPFGEHQMPSEKDPKKTIRMSPKFLDGKAPGGFLTDSTRRRALADAIVSKNDPWFAAAYVNRVWGALMGQAFYQPIDDLGPEKETTMPAVAGRLAAAFRGSDYDMKALFRAMLNSETYQRTIRPGEAPEDHLLFASNAPSRLSADILWYNLVNVLGVPQAGPRPFAMIGGPIGRFGSFESQFKQEFAFDPSAKAEEIEGSVSQALLLMNNPAINQRIRAVGNNVLARILSSYTSDDEASRMVYLKTFARRPTERELNRTKQYIRHADSRAEAYEDILWALINSTEFQTRR